jgi:Rrf2 family protein
MLTKRAKYAIKALLHLALREGDGPVQAARIAEAENIPFKFLEGILIHLRNAGLVASKLGKGGGHVLAKDPSEITLLTIVRTIDGPVAPLACLSQTAYQRCDDCEDEKRCGTRRMLARIQDSQLEQMGHVTLADGIIGKRRGSSSS